MVDEYKKEIAKLLKETDDIKLHIKVLRRKNEEITTDNNNQIGLLQGELGKVESLLKESLTKSGEESIKVKCGWEHWKHLKDKVVIKNVAETIKEIRKKLPSFVELLIQHVETYSIRRDKLNQLLKDGTIRIEVLDTVTTEPQDKKFEYRYTGE